MSRGGTATLPTALVCSGCGTRLPDDAPLAGIGGVAGEGENPLDDFLAEGLPGEVGKQGDAPQQACAATSCAPARTP